MPLSSHVLWLRTPGQTRASASWALALSRHFWKRTPVLGEELGPPGREASVAAARQRRCHGGQCGRLQETPALDLRFCHCCPQRSGMRQRSAELKVRDRKVRGRTHGTWALAGLRGQSPPETPLPPQWPPWMTQAGSGKAQTSEWPHWGSHLPDIPRPS